MSALAYKERKTLPRSNRILRHTDFVRTVTAGHIANKWFVIYMLGNKIGISRLGIIASKKVIPAAVARNYAKRLIREEFRHNFAENMAMDVVVRARSQLSKQTAKEGRLALRQLLLSVQT